MAKASAFTVFLVDQLQWLGPVTSRRMFGGTGLFLEGLMFALIVENTLYLKADTATRGDFDALGLPPFSYQRNGRDIALSYFQAPDEALDDRDLLIDWANRAYAAAMRAAAAKGGLKRG
ncbi:MAG: DNA transformation protein [Zhongshania aliphaticivorans]|jgi:DNA transformation protein|tara:strand:- start:15724 stop:16080 length:357 start_codon:yes stop_codon:yes gene_type:complete